jgi:hypothetical protein
MDAFRQKLANLLAHLGFLNTRGLLQPKRTET